MCPLLYSELSDAWITVATFLVHSIMLKRNIAGILQDDICV